MTAVYKRELKSYFTGMTGAIFAGFLLLMTGIFMLVINMLGGDPNFGSTLSTVSFWSMLAVPLLTMRSVAEEKHSRTDQLLYSLPISLASIVMAKYLAMVTVFAIPCGVMAFCPLILTNFGIVQLASAYSSLMAYFLLGSALISIGLFISSLTESQVIAAVVSMGTAVLIYLMSLLSAIIPDSETVSFVAFLVLTVFIGLIVQIMIKNTVLSVCTTVVLAAVCVLVYLVKSSLFEGVFPKMLAALAMFDRLSSFQNGMFDLTAVIFYLSIIALFVYLTVQSMEKKRWN